MIYCISFKEINLNIDCCINENELWLYINDLQS